MSAEDAPAWSPTDFAIHGEFCPPEEIAPVVEAARRRAEASAALLLVGDDWAVHRTLCTCVPHGDARVNRMRELLGTASLLPPKGERKRSSALQDYIRAPRDPHHTRRRFPATAAEALSELAEIARRAGDPEVAEWVAEGIPSWVPARLPARVLSARMNTALFLSEPRRRVQGVGAEALVAVDEELVEIAARVNSTAHANVRRDDLIMRRLDQKLDPAEYITGSVDFEAAAEALVEVAVDISGSDAGACYLVDQSKKRFRREAPPRLVREYGNRWEYKPELATRGSTLAAVAVEQHLTLQLPPGFGGRAVVPTVSMKGTNDGGHPDQLLELATPLPGPLAAPKAPAVGVLTVAKLSDPTPYGAYEMAVVRNVALRLALIANTTNTTQAAQMFARLSRRAGRLPMEASQRAKHSWDPPAVTLPDDILDAVPTIEDALTTLGRVTRSGTATFRAALPGGGFKAPHGLTLARVAGYPAKIGRSEKFAFQPETEGGYNWQAVRTGRIRSIPVVKPDDRNFSSHRKSTKSELAVPVFVEDRVIGVVNLESPVEHAFDGHIEIAQAAAEHIGLAIANVRLSLSGLVQERATDVLREAHQITKLPEEFEKELKGLTSSEEHRVSAAAEPIMRRVGGLARVDPEPPPLPESGDFSLPTLAECVTKAFGPEAFEVEEGRGPWRQHEPEVALVIVKALKDVLDNALIHRPKGAPRPRLALSSPVWGGQVQDILVVTSVASRVHSEAKAINIYRCPLEMESESERDLRGSQLGAYLAGLQIRRVGGEVHLSYDEDSVARVVLAIPAPTVAWKSRHRMKHSKRREQ